MRGAIVLTALAIGAAGGALAEEMADRYRDAIAHLPWKLNTRIERFRPGRWRRQPDSSFAYHYGVTPAGGETRYRLARPGVGIGEADDPAGERRPLNFAPQGGYALRHEGFDIVLIGPGGERRLTDDGIADLGYGLTPDTGSSPVTKALRKVVKAPYAAWTPDGRYLVTTLVDQRQLRRLPTLVSLDRGADHQIPRVYTPRVALPGDARVPTATLAIFETSTGRRVDVQVPPLMLAYDAEPMGGVRWAADGQTLFVGHESRDFRTLDIWRVDARNGTARVILTETGATTLRAMDTEVEVNPKMFEVVGDGDELILYSERDDIPRLYLADGETGDLKRNLTPGPGYVHRIVHIDEDKRRLYFLAGGRETDRDPYDSLLYAVDLDDAEPRLLTPEDADHAVEFSPDGRYLVDHYSSPEDPGRAVLRTAEGTVLHILSQPDISAIRSTGWKPGTPFTVKAADGVTDLYGMLYLPPDGSARSAPAIDAIYAGSQVTSRPRRFLRDDSLGQPLSRLGFAVFVLDARGTPRRTQSFQDVSFADGFGSKAILEDHIAAIRQLAERYPAIDPERVGIYGHSWGGYRAARAMLQFPDEFQVGVAMAGSHDNYLFAYEHDRWFGYPPEYPDSYRLQSNLPLAPALTGKLLLIHGDQDDQVPVANTLQLADALIAANRDFDMLILPGFGHAMQEDGYVIRRTWDYFVTHLLGATPPQGMVVPGD